MSTFEQIVLADDLCGEWKPVAEGGFPFGWQNTELDYEHVVAKGREMGIAEKLLSQVARMSADGQRKPGSGLCLSSNITRRAVIEMAKESKGPFSAWPSEIPTALVCDPGECTACRRVHGRWGTLLKLIKQCADMGPNGLLGKPKLPQIWLDWALNIAERVPGKIILCGMYAQGAYAEPLAGKTIVFPMNLRLTVAPNMFAVNYGYDVSQFARWSRIVPHLQLSAYDVVPLSTPQDDVEHFADTLKALGYRGVVLDRA